MGRLRDLSSEPRSPPAGAGRRKPSGLAPHVRHDDDRALRPCSGVSSNAPLLRKGFIRARFAEKRFEEARPRSLCEKSRCVSFRGAASGPELAREESRKFDIVNARFLASLGMTRFGTIFTQNLAARPKCLFSRIDEREKIESLSLTVLVQND